MQSGPRDARGAFIKGPNLPKSPGNLAKESSFDGDNWPKDSVLMAIIGKAKPRTPSEFKKPELAHRSPKTPVKPVKPSFGTIFRLGRQREPA